MPSKNRKTEKTRKNKSFKIDSDALRFLRTVDLNEAFHFYESIGKPTGQSATSLEDFLDKIESVKTESLLFHAGRKDFQNWIEKTIGDSTLAQRVEKADLKRENDLKVKMRSIVKRRIRELNAPRVSTTVDMEIPFTSLQPAQ